MSPPAPALGARLGAGVLWLAAARAVSALLTLGTALVVLRLIGPAAAGTAMIALSLSAILLSVTDLSLGSALMRHPAPREEHFDLAWTIGLIRGLALAAVLLLLAVGLGQTQDAPDLPGLLAGLALAAVIGGAANPKFVLHARALSFRQEFLLGTAQALAHALAALGVALWLASPWALVAGAIASQAAGTALSFLLRPYHPRLRWTGGAEFWSFSSWLTLTQGLVTANSRLDHLLVGMLLGPAALGLYAAAESLAGAILRDATAPVLRASMPAFAGLGGDPARLRDAFARAQAIGCALVLPMGAGLALVAAPAVAALLGPAWQPMVPVLQLFGLLIALQGPGLLVQPLAVSLGATRLLFNRNLQVVALRLPLTLLGALALGLPGVLAARAIGSGCAAWLNLRAARDLAGLAPRRQLLGCGRSLLATAGMALILLAVQGVLDGAGVAGLAALVGCGALAYGGLHLLSWLLAGRPAGPERDLLGLLAGLRAARLRPQALRL